MPDERETSFKVTDRRKFNADGSPRDVGAEPEVVAVAHEIIEPQSVPVEPGNASPASAPSNVVSFPGEAARSRETFGASSPSMASAAPASGPAPGDARESANAHQNEAEHAFSNAAGPRPAGVPEASFLDLLDMLAVQAALHLGMMPPQTQERLPIDLQLARHFIDMLAVVQAKTRGNLNADEESSLESALAELRMRYVELSRG
ncbi:MAG: DUF1844 domain-containing protein [Blastocatellia bacterium]